MNGTTETFTRNDGTTYAVDLSGLSGDLTNKGLKFAANSGDTVTNKLGSTVKVEGTGTKADSEYSGKNVKTKVAQDANGNTVIDVMIDNNIDTNSVRVGKDGADGTPGKDGVSITGPGGLDGTNGLDGKVGITGADGKDAVSLSVKDGVGHIGLTGPKGADGSDGASADISVKDGEPGVTGADGTTMARVIYVDKDGTEHQISTLDDGLKYMGDSGTLAKTKLNRTVNVIGGVTDSTKLTDGNIGTVSSQTTVGGDATITVKLNKDLKSMNSITMGDTAGDTTVSLSADGLHNGGNKITNVANGDVNSTSTDAVNGSQLYKAAAAATTTLENGTNTTVTYTTNQDGSKTYKVNVNANSTFGTGDTAINVNGETGKITAGTGDKAVTIDGTNATITAGKVTVDGTAGTVTGLTNKTWIVGTTTPVSGRAATEDQLKSVSDAAKAAGDLAKQHSTVTVNNGHSTGSLVLNTSKNADGSNNYDVSLADNINVGGTNGTNGSIGVNGKDGSNGVTISAKDDNDGHIGLNGKDGSSADIHVHDGAAGVNGKDGDSMTRVVYEDKSGTHDVATMDDGMKYSGDTGSAAVKLNKNVSVVGETTTGKNLTTGNIGVEAVQNGDNAKLVVKLADDLTGLKSITTETVKATTVNATTIKAGDTVTINNNGIDMGDTKITNIKDGDVTNTSTDAINGGQLYQYEQKTNTAITNIGNGLNDLSDRVDKVGAGAAALAALHPLDFDPDDKWDFAAGYGHYSGAGAAAIGAFYRPNEDTMFSVSASMGNGENMWNAGISIKLGQGNHVSTSRVAMAKEIVDLRNQVKQLTNMVNSLVGTIDPSKTRTFPDVPENHWAYEYVAKLAGNGIVEGYPDGYFKGDRTMTRYEFAAVLYRAMNKGAAIDGRLLNEFKPELDRIRVDAVNSNINRVRVIDGRG